MNASSRELLKILEHDDTLTSAEREALRKLRRGDVATPARAARILRRREVAERCACTLRTVDRWCAVGFLPRVKLPGHSRASGIPESAVAAMIAGATAAASVHERPAGE